MADETIWKRLTRLFKSGPIVRHKIAASETMPVLQGTAKAFKKELSSLYVRALSSYANYERLSRLSDYNEMESTPELSSALDIVADEATNENDEGDVITVTSSNEEIKETLTQLFFDIANINFNCWSWMRHFCKAGDFFLFIDATEENGIVNLLPIPVNEIEREEGHDPKDPMATRFRWLTRGNMILENWQIIHFRLLGNDAYLPYGTSFLESARRIWRQLILIEDAMLVYRIVRSPERRVFHIELGNIPPEEVDAYMEQVKTQLNRNMIVDPNTGRVDLRYNPLSVDENYYLPKRGETRSQIDTLAGGAMLGDIEDVQYIQSKMFSAIKIPKAYLSYEGDMGSKATLSQQDVRFSRTVQRIQKLFASELCKIAIIHLAILGYSGRDLVNFEIKMNSSSTIAEQQKLELWRMRLEVAAMAQEGVFDRKFIQQKIFALNDDEIAKIKDGKRIDKLEDQLLESITAPPEAGDAPGAAGPQAPGAEALPATLGAPPEGGEQPPEAGGEELPPPGPENASIRRLGQIVESMSRMSTFSPRSGKSTSGIAVDKGKDLFSTGEDQFNLTFGTEKQTASDPYDKRAQRRTVTRPFSEDLSDSSIADAYSTTETNEMILNALGEWLDNHE